MSAGDVVVPCNGYGYVNGVNDKANGISGCPATKGYGSCSNATVVTISDTSIDGSRIPTLLENATPGYIANAAVVATTVLAQSMLCHALDKNNFSEDGIDGPSLLLGLYFPHFLNKVVKRNWEQVSSNAQQIAALTAYTLFAVGADVTMYAVGPGVSSQPWYIGQTGVGAIINSLGFAISQVQAEIGGKRTYNLGPDPTVEELEKEFLPTTEMLASRKMKTIALVGTSAALASVATRMFVNPSSTLGTVVSMASYEIVNKVFKMGQKCEASTCDKVKVVFKYASVQIAMDAVVGAIMTVATGSPLLSTAFAANLLGGVAINGMICAVRLSVKSALDHEKIEKKAQKTETEKMKLAKELKQGVPERYTTAGKIKAKASNAALKVKGGANKETDTLLGGHKSKGEAEESESVSLCSRVKSFFKSPYVINTAAAAGSVLLNSVSFVKDHSAALYSAALVKHNVVLLSAREMYQNAKDRFVWKQVAAATPIAIAAACDVGISALSGMPIQWIATGTAAAVSGLYCGMAVAGVTLPGDGDTDE